MGGSEPASRLRAALHRARLLGRHPRLARAITHPGLDDDSLRERHAAYVSEVSDAPNALSLELARVLWGVCESRRPRHLADLGSGFSSYVFRLWAAERGAEVWSVDGSAEWLERTRGYLADAGLSTANLLLWDDFRTGGERDFELVLHDLGGMGMRADTLAEALDLVAPGGVIVLDDTHKDPYHMLATRELARRDWERFNLAWATTDSFGRYALLGIRPAAG